MSVEWFLILVGLWVLFGLIGAWVLRQLGRSSWRLVALCALIGPFSLAIVYDEARRVKTVPAMPDEVEVAETAESAVPDEPLVVDDEGVLSAQIEPLEWPKDDPESPLILQGYRSLSDH